MLITETIIINFESQKKGGNKMKVKKLINSVVTTTLCICMLFSATITSNAATWRATNSKTVNGYSLSAKANLPYVSDSKGGGEWKTQATYSGTKDNGKLTTSWSFYSVGGSVSWNGVGVSGSGTSTGSSYTVKGSTANANGYVYGTGLALYVGIISTASFTKGNTYYSISCKI